MPSAIPQPPKDQDETQALEEQDRLDLKQGEWQWYPWLYKDAITMLVSGAPGPTFPGGNQYSFAYNLNMGPIPELAAGGGDTTIIVGGGGMTDDMWKQIAKAISGGGGDAILLPTCLMTSGPASDFLNMDRLKTKFNNIIGTGPGIAVDFLEGSSPTCPYKGVEFNKACYAGAECKDGIQAWVIKKDGTRLFATIPSVVPYKDGGNPDPFAVYTFAGAMEFIWAQIKAILQGECDCQ